MIEILVGLLCMVLFMVFIWIIGRFNMSKDFFKSFDLTGKVLEPISIGLEHSWRAGVLILTLALVMLLLYALGGTILNFFK